MRLLEFLYCISQVIKQSLRMSSRFAKKLKELRVENGETQSELGKVLGVTLKQIQRYENNLVPKPEKIKVLNKHYKFDFFTVLNDEQVIKLEKDLQTVIGEYEERLLRTEAYIEVLQLTIIELMAKGNKTDIRKKTSEFLAKVQAAVNRRFDELDKESKES